MASTLFPMAVTPSSAASNESDEDKYKVETSDFFASHVEAHENCNKWSTILTDSNENQTEILNNAKLYKYQT